MTGTSSSGLGREVKVSNFRLGPADILVNVNRRKDPISTLERWLVGPYDHVFMYLGQVGILVNRRQEHILRFPMLFESNGRGVVIQSLSNRYGQEVVVLRLKSEFDRRRIPQVLEEAIKLASDPQAYYDYLCIVKYVLPELICRKLDAILPGDWVLPRPLKWHRGPWQICSEAVDEVFIRASLLLLSLEGVPLPGDFVTNSLLLEKVWAGRLSEEIV